MQIPDTDSDSHSCRNTAQNRNPRPLEEQFEPGTVATIRNLQERFDALPLAGHPARYFTAEINRCLDAGLLLAAMHVALSLLELLFRELLIASEFEKRSLECEVHPVKLQYQIREEIEDTHKLGLKKIVAILSERGLVGSSDAAELRGFYDGVRIPIHHAIIGRLVKKFSWIHHLRELLLPVTLQDFDDMIEETALTHLDTMAHFLNKYSAALDAD